MLQERQELQQENARKDGIKRNEEDGTEARQILIILNYINV